MRIKLLIADVDGTLVTPEKLLTQRTIEAVDRLRATGVAFMITSGRPPRGMSMLVGPLKLTAPVAAFNGGMFVEPDLTTVLARRTIPTDVAKEAVDTLLEAGLDAWLYQGDDWFVRRRDAYRVDRERYNVGFEPVVVDDLYGVLDGPIKIVGVSEDRSLVSRCERELNERLGADATAVRSQPYYVDVTHPEANKGMVVREASRILQIPVAEIATIGDMANDVPMLHIAGMSIAMGNAAPEVQRIARHVTGSNADEGFASAVETYILGEPPLARTRLGLPPRARACLFGLEGVLTQTIKLHAAAWKELFDHQLRRRARASGEPFIPFDAVRDYSLHFEGRAPVEGARLFLESRGIELRDTTIEALVGRKAEIMAELLKEEPIETYEGTLSYLRAARAGGLRTAVVSSSTHCREALVAAGIADLFDARIDAAYAEAEHLAGKPAPDAYLAAAQAVGVDAERAVVFEDEVRGVEAGRAGHFGYVVGVDRLGHAAELRAHGADVVVPDLAALLEPGGRGEATSS
ncbi:MAG TPA: Cof-type HAD-IIB family hydrolase [Polyangia bacterium]|nr:Cof-type HAD-IIB family hydrolase [Polyangia bacterium]